MNATPTTQPPRPPALRAGGEVLSIVPHTFEDVMRIARAVIMSGLAPAALVGKLSGDAAAAAVAIVIMSGAELGLQPMVAMRSFTVINGKPALYGDGLINVVRQSGKVAYLRTGCETRDKKLVGWCEAKRSDTNEEKRVEFSQDDAIRAGLWSDTPKVTKQGRDGPYTKENDSPWFRYPQRMLAWRAAGWCLRELFGDVLGGIRDEFEAREAAEFDDMRDITPEVQRVSPPVPPEPGPQPEPEQGSDETGEVDHDETAANMVESFLGHIEITLEGAASEDAVIELWDELDVEATLTDNEEALARAFTIKKLAIDAATKPADDGQATMFPGDKP